MTEDHPYFFLNDETDEQNFGHNTRTRVFNTANLTNVALLGFYSGPTTAIDHNLYIKGRYCQVPRRRQWALPPMSVAPPRKSGPRGAPVVTRPEERGGPA
ncbi:hypothetical protein SAMN05444920_1583 [Nonomuraea solani]|uniref:Uncharacterized protein n=1 Tax=Nonomuraea solani TaxID=1144553 RepID=A0A1H6F3X7_9ACTN|nr:hypothetical protein [Nonomuraea solani]SEH04091.1 hypothetical protein SAMN05444920_1583 [Nonomuraea solani]